MTPTTKAALDAAGLLEANGKALLQIAGQRSKITGEPFPCDHPSLLLGNAQIAGASALRLIAEARKAEECDTALQEADQNAALVVELREKIAGIKSSMVKSNWKADCDHGRSTCESIGCNGQYFAWIEYVAGQALSLTPPAALERVQREAAAKALEEQVDRLRSMGTGGESPYAVARNTAVAEMIVDITKRVKELREASHG